MKSRYLSLLAGASLLFLLSACGGGGSDADVQAPAAADPSKTTGVKAVAVGANEVVGLDAAVSAALRTAKSDQARSSYGEATEPVIEPQRRSADGDWVFGGAYFPIPAHVTGASPVNALFIAHRSPDGWAVTLEDASDFHDVLEGAAPELTSHEERRVFTSRAASLKSRQGASAQAVGQDIGLSLPYRKNDSSWGMWGVHGDGGNTRPYNSIDFMAGDGRVLASRGGVAYKFCTNGRWPFIKVVHDNGFTTGYYHLRGQATINNGQRVQEGDFIGNIGVELPCGGTANGDHVHWSLWRGDTNGKAEPVNGKLIGGWTWYESSQAYSGYAERNGQRIQVGAKGLVNYGHGGTTPPPSSPPCTGAGCNSFTGNIGAAGQFVVHPGDKGFKHTGGSLKAWLKGPDGTNFDLILGRYNASTDQWDRAAASEGPKSEESITYDAPAGTYRWRVSGVTGKGGYTLWTKQ